MSTPVATSLASVRERWRHRLFGLAFIVVAALLAFLMVAQYNQEFTPVYHVTVRSDRTGLQLLPHSDVKVQGLIVGEVRSIHPTATGASIDLAIKPDKAPLIPANSSARMLPKTVFGEKYVDLVRPPAGQREGHLRNGSIIPQDRSATAVEVTQVLNDVMPILRAVKPEKLNATLNALATALQGRGEEIGDLAVQADAYLKKINTQLPTIVQDMRLLSTETQNLTDATPDLLTLMRNLQVTSQTVADKQPQLASTLTKGIDLTDEAIPFAEENEPRIEGAMIATRPALSLVARYSPSIPCVFTSMLKVQPRLIEAMGGAQPGVHVTLEIIKPRPPYKPGLDLPENKDQRNPRCYGLPNPKVPFPQYQLLDGTQDDQWYTGPGGARALSSALVKPGTGTDSNALLKDMLGAATGTRADQVPDLASLLYTPAANGSVVTLK